MKIVSRQQATDYLRRDTSDDDALLDLLIEAASGAVVNYLGEGADAWLDSNGDLIEDSNGDNDAPEAVKGAVLYLTGWLYRHRDEDVEKAFQPGYLPAPVTAMLYPLRDPVLQ